jgi:hypothetical protein
LGFGRRSGAKVRARTLKHLSGQGLPAIAPRNNPGPIPILDHISRIEQCARSGRRSISSENVCYRELIAWLRIVRPCAALAHSSVAQARAQAARARSTVAAGASTMTFKLLFAPRLASRAVTSIVYPIAIIVAPKTLRNNSERTGPSGSGAHNQWRVNSNRTLID